MAIKEFNINLDKITVDPLEHQGNENDWRNEYEKKQYNLSQEKIDAEVNKRKQEKIETLMNDYKSICAFFAPGFTEIYGENFDEHHFYNLINSFESKKLLDFILSVRFIGYIDKLPENYAGLKALFMFSFIESITNEEYISLDNWLKSSDNKEIIFPILKDATDEDIDAKIKEIINLYYKEYGAKLKVFKFLDKNLLSQEKMKLLQNIKFKNLKETNHDYVPICFKTDIYDACNKKRNYWVCCDCKIEKDSKLMSQAFEKLVSALYDMRSQFVHNAKYVEIVIPNGEINCMFDAYKKGNNYKHFSTQVDYQCFKELIIKATIRHLQNNNY